MEERQIMKNHKVVVNNRKTSTLTGVLDVLSFDLNEILLETEQGMLMVKGNGLHVNRLTSTLTVFVPNAISIISPTFTFTEALATVPLTSTRPASHASFATGGS